MQIISITMIFVIYRYHVYLHLGRCEGYALDDGGKDVIIWD